ncbi:MAG: phosphoserine phosphatase SerB [Janthinobacterium lividum]
MILILQSPLATPSSIDLIAGQAGAHQVTQLNAQAWSCEDVDGQAATQALVQRSALEQGVDATYLAAPLALADFRLLAMDMDSTLITIECIDEIADLQGLKPQVAAITEAAMRGEIAFGESLTRRVALLKGLDAAALQRVYDQRLALSPGAENMLGAVHAAGIKTLLVSGGFTFFTERVKQRLGLDYAHSNELEILDGKLTGRVVGGIVDATEKKRTVQRICAELGITTQQAIVMGDGANDLEMMAVSGLSVAFRAKPLVREKADVALNFSGLDGILNLMTRQDGPGA